MTEVEELEIRESLEAAIQSGDEVAELVAREKLEKLQPNSDVSSNDDSFPGAGIVEPALTVGSAALAEIASGLIGGAAAPFVGAEGATDIIENTQEDLTFQPRTPAGKEGLQNLGNVAEGVTKQISLYQSLIGGLVAKLDGKSNEEAGKIAREIQEKGIGQTLGDRRFKETGSPLLATIAGSFPSAALEVAGVKGVGSAVPKALQPFADHVSRRVDKPELQVFDESGKFTDEALTEIEKLDNADEIVTEAGKNGAVLTPEQAQRFNLFKERGVTPLRADITQSTDDFIDQQSALKRSGPVADIAAQQEQQLIDLTQSGIDKIPGDVTDLPGTNASVFQAVDNIVTAIDNDVTEAYRAAAIAARGEPRVTLNNFAKAISDNRGRERVTGGVISSARQTLNNKGLVKAGENIDINKRGSRTKGGDLKKLTVTEAEDIRQELNSLFDSVTPQGRRLIRKLKNALDNDVASAVGQDIFRDARLSKIRFQETIERGARNKFDTTKSSFLEDVIDNKIPEEQIVPKLLRGRDDDLIKFKKFLTQDAGQQGVQAWDNIRAQVLRDALDKATSTVGKREGGQQVFNVRLFRNAFKPLRNNKKFNEIFNADERKLIRDIEKIGNLRIPPGNAQQGAGPTEMAIIKNEARKQILRKIPVVGESAQGILDVLTNKKTDQRLLDVTRQTEDALRKSGAP